MSTDVRRAMVSVYCQCHRYLGRVPVTGQPYRIESARCRRCHRPQVVFIQADGHYLTQVLPADVDAAALPWPDRGWRA